MSLEQNRLLSDDKFWLIQLENFNKAQQEAIDKYINTDGLNSKCSQLARIHTIPRFSVILNILKSQEKRIQELESLILSNKKIKKDSKHPCDVGFLNG